jgi:glutamate-1-semialdehyde 2,1-aminomutase
MEPALTNIGIVLPEDGYLEGVRDLTRKYGALLINDETHTLSAGPGGCTRAWNLHPDMLTIGKAIGGGIPTAAYGLSEDLAQRVTGHPELDMIDVGGVGGTLAGNALSVAAMRATLEQVLTDEAFAAMIALAGRLADGLQAIIDRYQLPWSLSRLGARAEYRFTTPPPRSGGESHAAGDTELEDYLHVGLVNRGLLMTPFHNMSLVCPSTSQSDIQRHLDAIDACLGQLLNA